jgi:5-methylthioadenosine/S-adenosylhomocysteine deaminase
MPLFALLSLASISVAACRSDDDVAPIKVGPGGTGGTEDVDPEGGTGGDDGTSGTGGTEDPGGGGGTEAAGTGGGAGTGGTAGTGGGTAGTGGGSGTGGTGGGSGAGGGAGKGGSAGGPIVTPTGGAELTPGDPSRILLKGVVVTPDEAFVGQVLVKGTKIVCARAGNECEGMADAAGASVLVTNGIIAPGMIDTHNHILFDIFNDDDWLPSKSYQNATQWTDKKNEPRYGAMVDTKQCLENSSYKPTDKGGPKTPDGWCDDTKYGSSTTNVKCEMHKWGELKGLISGTTSIVGLPGTSTSCYGTLTRSIDTSYNLIAEDLGTGTKEDFVQTSALFPPSNTAAEGVCKNIAAGKTKAYLIHCGEGIDEKTYAQFDKLASLPPSSTAPEAPAGCLMDSATTITHGTAFDRFPGRTEFETMAAKGMKLTWSPKSNFALYGETTLIPKAKAAGVQIALAPDWSLGGSQNMLDELAFASKWDNDNWGDILTSQDIVTMATKNAAAVVALAGTIGEIKEGYLADLFIVGGTDAAPFDDVVASKPKDVRLVMIGGRVLYGDAHLISMGHTATSCETVDICGVSKFACVADGGGGEKFEQTMEQIKTVIETALTDTDTARRGRNPDQDYNFAPIAPIVICQ